MDMTIASIGHVENDTHMVAAEIATNEELTRAREQGAKGIICCRYIAEDGNEVRSAPYDRVVAASLEDMKRAPKKLLIVCGSDRLEATRAAIEGGLVTHLVVDQDLGTALLANMP